MEKHGGRTKKREKGERGENEKGRGRFTTGCQIDLIHVVSPSVKKWGMRESTDCLVFLLQFGHPVFCSFLLLYHSVYSLSLSLSILLSLSLPYFLLFQSVIVSLVSAVKQEKLRKEIVERDKECNSADQTFHSLRHHLFPSLPQPQKSLLSFSLAILRPKTWHIDLLSCGDKSNK